MTPQPAPALLLPELKSEQNPWVMAPKWCALYQNEGQREVKQTRAHWSAEIYGFQHAPKVPKSASV